MKNINFFSENLKSLRAKHKLSQKQVGEAIGVTKQTINDMEQGRSKTTLDRAIALADYFNVSLDYLTGRSGNAEINVKLRDIQLYTLKASAGSGQFLDSDNFETIQVDSKVPTTASFGVLISGESMEPKYPNGSSVWVQRKKTIENGQAGIFYLNGDVYCKILSISNGRTQLVSLNKKYEPITLRVDDTLRCYGLIVGVTILN